MDTDADAGDVDVDVDEGELIDLERQAWKALSTSGEAATAYYREMLADEVLMLLPGGMAIDDRTAVVESMGGEPWSSFSLADERVEVLTAASAVVAYRATAQRGDMTYEALFTSTYVRTPNGWRLRLHQQTPI